MSSNYFYKSRKEIFNHFSLKKLELDDTYNFLNSLNLSKFSVNLFDKFDRPLIQPRGGFSSVKKQNKLNIELEKSGSDIIPLTIDSFTRLNDYNSVEQALRDEKKERIEILNGYPLVNHKFEKTRSILNNIASPVSLRHGTSDARLLVEHALASGITDIEGGGLSYSLPYSKNLPIEKALLFWSYVDELCSIMSQEQKEIMRESFGVLTATLVPPLIIIIVQILELLMAAKKGVQAFMMTFGQTGSLIQDIVTATCLRDMSKKFLERYEFKVKHLKLGYHHWMGPFPLNFERSNAIIVQGTINAALIKADKLIIKTKHEAHSIPTIEANCEATSLVKFVLETFKIKDELINNDILLEIENLKNQSECVLENILKNKKKIDLIDIFDAVNQGYIDIPFSPHYQNKNKLRTYRDAFGMIRISDYGNIPLTDKLKKNEIKLLNKNKSYLNHNEILDGINFMANKT